MNRSTSMSKKDYVMTVIEQINSKVGVAETPFIQEIGLDSFDESDGGAWIQLSYVGKVWELSLDAMTGNWMSSYIGFVGDDNEDERVEIFDEPTTLEEALDITLAEMLLQHIQIAPNTNTST